VGNTVREEDVDSSSQRFVEQFPPPSIVPKARTDSTPAPARQPYRVIAACDLSDMSEGVLKEALAFAHGGAPSELHLITVVEKVHDGVILHAEDHSRRMTLDEVQGLMNHLLWKVVVPKGTPLEDVLQRIATHIAFGDTAAEILRLANDVLADLIVVGARGHTGWKRRVWGSVSKTIATDAECSVVMSRPVEFAHGSRTPSVEPPRPWTGESHLGTRHTYHHYDSISGMRSNLLRWEM